MCASTRAEVTLADFTATVEAAPRPAAYEITRVAFLDEPGNSAAVGVRATDRTGSAREFTLYLDSEGGPYEVCGTDLI